jgi:hypothetical protein
MTSLTSVEVIEGNTVIVTETLTGGMDVIVSSGTALADPVLVYWQSSDVAAFPTGYQTYLQSLIGSPLQAGTNTGTPASPPILALSGLSTGAKAGIGVGAAIGGILLCVTVGALVLRRRRKKRQQEYPSVP